MMIPVVKVKRGAISSTLILPLTLFFTLVTVSFSSATPIETRLKAKVEDCHLLEKRSDHPLTPWGSSSDYNSYDPPTVNLPEVYGRNQYQPPPAYRTGFPPEIYGVHAPSFDSLEEFEEETEDDEDDKKRHASRKGKKSTRRPPRVNSRRLDQGDVPDAPGAVVAGNYGYHTNGPGSPMVCGSEADKTYGYYGGGTSTNPEAQGNGFNPPTPAGYVQPVNPNPGSDFSKAKPCVPGQDSYNPDLNDYHNVLGNTDAGSNNGGTSSHPHSSSNSNYNHLIKENSSSHAGLIATGAVVGTGLAVGSAYLGYRQHKKKQEKSNNHSHEKTNQGHEHKGDVYYDQEAGIQSGEWETMEKYHDASMYGYGNDHGYYH